MNTTNNNTFRTERKDRNGNDVIIEISLNDECKNGYERFLITGDVYKKNRKRTDRNLIISGAIGDYISEEFPEFKIFNNLHLSRFDGTPMYAIENGLYFIKEGNLEAAKNHFRISDEEMKEIRCAENEQHLYFLLKNKGIIQKWKDEAGKAISILESLTKNKFESKGDATYFSKFEEKLQETKERIESGYYSEENIIKRKEKALVEKIASLINDIKKDAKSKKEDIDKKANIEITLLEHSLFDAYDNHIYYSHTNTVAFNWKNLGKQVSEEEINKAKKVLSKFNVEFK